MAAWVLESAHRYARAAALLERESLMYESEVNAALAMELVLKSLIAAPVENDRKGTVLQQYTTRQHKLRDGHNLLGLYKLVPSDIAEYLGLSALEDLLVQKQDVFKRLRYIYELEAPGGSTTLLLDAVGWLIPQVIVYFGEQGDQDLWLAYMRANPEKMRVR
jgi:hypothetical protein